MTELWIIRHAATSWNLEKRYQGSRDIELCLQGKEEAARWGISFPSMDRVFSSPLTRAKQTAEILFPKAEISIAPELRELALGEWEGKTLEELDLPFVEWRGLDFAPPGGESLSEVVVRVRQFLESLPKESGRVAVVTHKMTLHAFYALATGWKADQKPEERLRFPKIHRFQYNGNLSILKLNEPL